MTNQALTRNIMVVGAHADDNEINTGGTLSKYLGNGYKLIYVQSTNNMSGSIHKLSADGSQTITTPPWHEIMPIRKRECEAAAKALGTTPIHLDHPQRHYTNDEGLMVDLRFGAAAPGSAAGVPTILTAYEDKAARKAMKQLIVDTNPAIVFTHGISQKNIEHVGTCLLVTLAFHEAVADGYDGSLLHWREGFDFLGEVNTHWDTFVDITDHVDRKMELIGIHDCQMPHWRKADFGHRLRASALGEACGCGGAEQFTWVRRADADGGDLMTELIANTR